MRSATIIAPYISKLANKDSCFTVQDDCRPQLRETFIINRPRYVLYYKYFLFFCFYFLVLFNGLWGTRVENGILQIKHIDLGFFPVAGRALTLDNADAGTMNGSQRTLGTPLLHPTHGAAKRPCDDKPRLHYSGVARI